MGDEPEVFDDGTDLTRLASAHEFTETVLHDQSDWLLQGKEAEGWLRIVHRFTWNWGQYPDFTLRENRYLWEHPRGTTDYHSTEWPANILMDLAGRETPSRKTYGRRGWRIIKECFASALPKSGVFHASADTIDLITRLWDDGIDRPRDVGPAAHISSAGERPNYGLTTSAQSEEGDGVRAVEAENTEAGPLDVDEPMRPKPSPSPDSEMKFGYLQSDIPIDHRTRLMSMTEAASYLIGGQDGTGPQRQLKIAINAGEFRVMSRSRESHHFDLRQFAESAREKVRPTPTG